MSEQEIATVQPETPGSLVTVAVSPRDFGAKIVTDTELQTLGFTSAAGALYMTVFGAAVGATISLWLTLDTVANLTPNQHAGYVAALIVSVVCVVVFGVLSVLTFVKSKQQVTTIEKESAKRKVMLFGGAGPLAQ
jgi:cytochrome bd-type quinol oxidase subunit 2